MIRSPVRRDVVIALVLFLLMLAVPLLTGTRYVLTQLTVFFIWAVVASQWNLVLGVAGIFSLAQMALFAVGAYATAMLAYYIGLMLPAAMLLAALVTVGVSLVIGFACLRLKGPYVALLTLAIGQVMYLLVVNDTACFTTPASGCLPLFGGARGFSRFGDLGFRDLLGSKWYVGHYYTGLVLLLAAQLFCIAIIHGPLGLAFRGLRDNPGLALARGVSRMRYQLWVFGLSAFFTGLAGAFHAAHFGVVGPTAFAFAMLLFILAMIVVGGLGTTWGPLIGAALLMWADEGLREVSDWREIGIGLVLAGCVILFPKGLAGIRFRFGQGSGQRPDAPPAPPPHTRPV